MLAATHIVCSDCHIGKVSKAVDMSERGDTIIIKSGTYTESLIEIDKPLTIIGKNLPKIKSKKWRENFPYYCRFCHYNWARVDGSKA